MSYFWTEWFMGSTALHNLCHFVVGSSDCRRSTETLWTSRQALSALPVGSTMTSSDKYSKPIRVAGVPKLEFNNGVLADSVIRPPFATSILEILFESLNRSERIALSSHRTLMAALHLPSLIISSQVSIHVQIASRQSLCFAPDSLYSASYFTDLIEPWTWLINTWMIFFKKSPYHSANQLIRFQWRGSILSHAHKYPNSQLVANKVRNVVMAWKRFSAYVWDRRKME